MDGARRRQARQPPRNLRLPPFHRIEEVGDLFADNSRAEEAGACGSLAHGDDFLGDIENLIDHDTDAALAVVEDDCLDGIGGIGKAIKGLAGGIVGGFKSALGIKLLSSDLISAALWPCMARSLYNGQKILQATFEDEAAREDFLIVQGAVLEFNLRPFFKSLGLLSPAAPEKSTESQK